MSLKDNFNQAVKELLKRDGLVGDNLNKNAKEKNLLKVTPENNSYIINTNYLTALNTETIELFSILNAVNHGL